MTRWSLAVVAFTVACSQAAPTNPTPTPGASPLPAPTPSTYTLSGMITATNGGQPVSGASIDVGGVTTQSDGGGRYMLTLPTRSGLLPFTISGAGLALAHGGYVQAGTTRNVAFDAIATAGFNTQFYRQLARSQLHDGKLYPIERWTSNPNIYVRTIDTAGRPIEPEVLALTLDWINRAIPIWTTNQFQVGALETGRADRPDKSGWIVVEFERDPSSNYCGYSTVGANPGRVTLNDDRCSCGSLKVPATLVLHEFGHALGFGHVDDRASVMFPILPGGCRTPSLSLDEQRHAAIAYSRPNGNTDPDNDPSTASATLSTRRIQN